MPPKRLPAEHQPALAPRIDQHGEADSRPHTPEAAEGFELDEGHVGASVGHPVVAPDPSRARLYKEGRRLRRGPRSAPTIRRGSVESRVSSRDGRGRGETFLVTARESLGDVLLLERSWMVTKTHAKATTWLGWYADRNRNVRCVPRHEFA